ncbi:hypothetical protein F511_30001 [Dorcoceras hygrometricum]|uniref:CCHC-type domain-containing protein n=1 Tax=Dorcoceras hygrometricum TaxID=472368 RepID=A0A2Z7CZ94_9LAMI|nr:hypothetical protein F511_30001 [Dorcoceras hygrometricum]
MSASGESSTTMHRLLHASGSHPIPTPYDPNSSSSSSEFKQLGAGQEFGDYCTKCGGRHATEQCRGVSGLCRICNQSGHFARICPQRNSGKLQNSEAARTVSIPERQASSVHSFQPQNQQQGRQGGSQTVSQPPKQQARVFALTEEQAQAAPDDFIAETADEFGDELEFLEGEKCNARNYYIEI